MGCFFNKRKGKMKKVLLSSLVALMAITTANAAGVSGIASTDYVDNAIGNIEIPEVVDVVADGNGKAVTSNAVADALATKADSATTYTKTETDNLLDDKYDANKITVADGAVTIDGTQIATKADISSLPTTGALENKINKTDVDGDLSDATDLLVPSTAAVKTALGTKADKATTYTKTETDGLLDAKADKETTLSGYGITDAYTKTETDGLLDAKADKETTLSGYGITDAYTKTETDVLLGAKADKETTLSGYGITDAYTKTETDGLLEAKANSATTYTKTETDGLLGAKADKETTLSGYGITDAYTKTETDGLLGAKANSATTLSGYGITDAYTKTETDGYLNSKVDTTKVYNGTVIAAPDNESTQALIPSVATMSKDVSTIYGRVDGVEKDAVRVDANKNMIVENNTDYGDCAVGDTCTLVAVRTASGMQSVWKKIFPAAAQ